MSADRCGKSGATEAATDRLEMRVVEYPEAADRCTIYPADCPERDRLTRWISADRDRFVSLELRR